MENKKIFDVLYYYVMTSSSINIAITCAFGMFYIRDLIEIETIDLILTIFLVNISCMICIKQFYINPRDTINRKVYKSDEPC